MHKIFACMYNFFCACMKIFLYISYERAQRVHNFYSCSDSLTRVFKTRCTSQYNPVLKNFLFYAWGGLRPPGRPQWTEFPARGPDFPDFRGPGVKFVIKSDHSAPPAVPNGEMIKAQFFGPAEPPAGLFWTCYYIHQNLYL